MTAMPNGEAPPTLVVTGAGAGIGAAIAAAAVHAGWTVGIVDRDATAATSAAEEIGAHAIPLTADVTDETSIERALDEFSTATGSGVPDALVCNAGIVRFGPLLELSLADWSAVVNVNLHGTFVTARAVARRMIAAGRPGSIVNITSINGIAPGPNAGAYGATKAAIALLTQQMALEWGSLGVRVNAVAPGLIDAGMSEPIYADADIRQRRSERVPLQRLGQASDIAHAVLFLLSDAASYINGTELVVDGGVSMSVISTLPRPAAVEKPGSGGGASGSGS